MTEPIRLDQIRCFPVPQYLRDQGMRCFANILINGRLRVDGLVVRRTRAGEYVVTWPERRDGAGRSHAIVRLLDAATRLEVENAVLAEAVRGGWADRTPERHGGAA